ncbi:MAG: hypothetical protein JNL17_11000 [Cyclobacteriaceae bacterium]|nr:hypothetical protein [Cyclobacteriaceae bacterium]
MIWSQSWAQSQNSIFLRTHNKTRLYCVELQAHQAKVYKMVYIMDKAGSGPVIQKIDTLDKSSSTQYFSNDHQLVVDGKNQQLRVSKKVLPLTSVNTSSAHYELNKGYHLKKYFGLSDTLNKKYPLYHYSFRNGFYSWDAIPVKDANPEIFRSNTDREVKKVYDSLDTEQSRYVRMTNFLLANLRELSDSTLIDSLASLPRGQTIPAKYFGTVVYEVARQKPNSYFRVADAFPSNWSIIFGAVQHDKRVVKSLRKAEGSPKTKDAFFKAIGR